MTYESVKCRGEHGAYHSIVIIGTIGGASLSIELAMITFSMGLGASGCFGWLFLGRDLSR